jgi:lipopolysaccharide transport system permease protein
VFVIIIPRLSASSFPQVPYPLVVYSALAPWLYFSRAVTRASTSFVEHSDLLGSVYFPRLLLPLVAIVEALVDFMVICCCLMVFMLFYRVPPSNMLFMIIVFTVMACAAALGLGLILSVLHVYYRDVFQIVQFSLQLGMVLNPVCYSIRIFPEPWRWLAGLNPMFGVIAGFRWAILGLDPPGWRMELLSAVSICGLMMLGLRIFRARQDGVVDVL